MTEPWSDAFLDRLRHQGDPLADGLIQSLAGDGEVQRVRDLLLNLIRLEPRRLEQALGRHLSEAELQQFLSRSGAPPPWLDPALIDAGEALFRRDGALAFLVLACASLPACYSWAWEAEILGLSGRLVTQAPRRLPETAQMVVDVMHRGGLAPDGVGIRAAQKVRLLHAAMRWLLIHEPAGEYTVDAGDLAGVLLDCRWDPTTQGMPLSQEQLAGTLLTFSYAVLTGMEGFGIRFTPREQAAYLHCWNRVGYALGLDDTVLQGLADPAAAARLWQRIMARNRAPTPAGPDLTAALLGYIENNVRRLLPLHDPLYLRRVPRLVLARLAGPDTCAVLGLRLSLPQRLAYGPVWLVLGLLGRLYQFAWRHRLFWVHQLARRGFVWLSQRVWDWRREGEAEPPPGPDKRPRQLVLPAELLEHWRQGRGRP